MIAVQCCCLSRAKQANNRRTSKHAIKLGSKQSVHFVACQHAQPSSDTLSRICTVANVGSCYQVIALWAWPSLEANGYFCAYNLRRRARFGCMTRKRRMNTNAWHCFSPIARTLPVLASIILSTHAAGG